MTLRARLSAAAARVRCDLEVAGFVALAGAGLALAAVSYGVGEVLQVVYPPPPRRREPKEPKRYRTPRQRYAQIDDTVDPLAARTDVRSSHADVMASLERRVMLP